MAAYLASVGLKTVLVSYIRNLTLSVNVQLLVHVTSDPNSFSRLLLFICYIVPPHSANFILKLLTFFVSFSALCNVYVHHMHRFVYSKEVGVMYIHKGIINIYQMVYHDNVNNNLIIYFCLWY